MNETDAGDYAIGEAHAPKAAAKKPVASGQVGPVFGVPAKLEVSPLRPASTWGCFLGEWEESLLLDAEVAIVASCER